MRTQGLVNYINFAHHHHLTMGVANEVHKEAKFNSALGQSNRINFLLDLITNSSTKLDPYNWYHNLRAFFREISSKMDIENVEHFQDTFHDLKTQIDDFSASIDEGEDGAVEPQLYDRLELLEINLRRSAEAVGLLIPDKENFMSTMADWDDKKGAV